MTRAITVIVAMLLAPGCCLTVPYTIAAEFSCANAYRHDRYRDYKPPVTWDVKTDAVTPRGIRVDTANGAGGVDLLLRIDALVDEWEACYGQEVRRCGFRVKVIPPLLTVPVEGFFCGQGNSGICTGVTQYPDTVIVTPNLAALKHELTHAIAHRDHGDVLFRCE